MDTEQFLKITVQRNGAEVADTVLRRCTREVCKISHRLIAIPDLGPNEQFVRVDVGESFILEEEHP